jgi:hypothetical protein
VVVISAPVLHDVAGRISGRDSETWTEDPMRWAYAVREAVSVVRPAWVVSHYDPKFECRAINTLASEPDAVWDVEVDSEGPFAPGIELVRTLATLDPTWTVAASITGPMSTAHMLCESWGTPSEDLEDLQDACGDVIASLAASYAQGGASEIIVWECDAHHSPQRAEAAQQALVRRAAHVGVPLSLVSPAEIPGYARTIGKGILVLPVETLADRAKLRTALTDAGSDTVVITAGPVPGDTATEALFGLSPTATAGGR